MQAAQLLAEVKRLAEVDPKEWAKQRDDLARRIETFASTRSTPALASAAGDRARGRAAESIAEARRLIAAAKAPQAVPPVTGEEELAPRVVDKSATADDVIAWMTRLSLNERKTVVQRYEAVSGGAHKGSPDRFAVALVNFLAEHRGLSKRLQLLATRSQKQVAQERAQQAELDAEAAVETEAPVAVAADVTMVAPRYADSATSKYLGEHWQEVRAQVVAVFAAKAHGWLDPQLAWGLDTNALATHAIEGLLPTMYMPGTLESLVDSVDELVEGARAVGRQPGGRDDAWNPAVGRAIGRDLEEQVGRAVRTMSANYARMSANRRGASPRDLLKPVTRYERIAVDLLEQGHVHASGRPAAKPTPASTPTPAEREAVLGPAVEGRVAPGSELTLEPASPIPVDVDAHDAQRSTLRNASAAADYAEAGGPGGALAVDTARERFDGLDGSDSTSADLDARIDTFLLHLAALSQNLHKTSDALFGSGETIAHVAGLYWVARAEDLAHRALAVDHTIATVRARLRGQLEGVTDRAQRQRLLASAQTEIAAKLSQTQLVELSEQATAMLRDVEQAANVIFTINSMVISIALSLVAAEVGAVIASSLLSALARTTMTGATMVAAEGAAFVAGQITEAAINAAFQAALFGDDSGEAFAENLLASLLAQVGTRGMGRLNEAAVRAGEAGMGRAGRAGLELATGAGAGVVAQRAVRSEGSVDTDPVLLGISVTFGHWLGRRIAKAKERVATRGGAEAEAGKLDELARRTERLLASGAVDRDDVVRLIADAHDVLRAVEGGGATTAAREVESLGEAHDASQGRAVGDGQASDRVTKADAAEATRIDGATTQSGSVTSPAGKHAVDPALTESLHKALQERGLDLSVFQADKLDELSVMKVTRALTGDSMHLSAARQTPEVLAARKRAEQWALEGAHGDPREFANRYEYARARFVNLKHEAEKGLKGVTPPKGMTKDKLAGNEAAAKITAEGVSADLAADISVVEELGPGSNRVDVHEGDTPADIAARVQRLERVPYESPSAEAYHAQKHKKDLEGLSELRADDAVTRFAEATRLTLTDGAVYKAEPSTKKEATAVIIRRSFPTVDGESKLLEAILYVDPDGQVVLATFGEKKAK